MNDRIEMSPAEEDLRDAMKDESGFDDAPLEKFIINLRGEQVRIAPCSKPEHIYRFHEGYAVVSCGECVLEVTPEPLSSATDRSEP